MTYSQMAEIAVVVLFFVGYYGLISSKSILKSIVAIVLMETAIFVFFLNLGFFHGVRPPIGSYIESGADPLPQALILTAIIIGMAVTAVNLVMFIALYRQYKTSDWDKIKKENMV